MQYTVARLKPHASSVAKFTRRAALMALLTITCMDNARADEYLNLLGGSGGGRFAAHCPEGQLLNGFDLRAADDVDAIRPLCVTASGQRDVSAAAPATGWYGGTGGGPASVVCPGNTPVVTGMFVLWEGVDTYIVNSIRLFCGVAVGTQVVSDVPSAVFDAPRHKGGGIFASFSGADKETQRCAAGQLAVGLHGRSGIWVDAIGLICATPSSVSGTTATSLGKKGGGGPSTPRPPGWTPCDSARDARARNSPVAPNLEAQCEASKTVVTSIGKSGFTSKPPGPADVPMTLCERARDARARNSPAAPNLEAQCRASGGKL